MNRMSMQPEDHYLEIGIRAHLRLWSPDPSRADQSPPYILLHGLSSNARTWDQVAARLADSGRRSAAIDQRGHGLSGKPEDGYDFGSITRDLEHILQQLDWEAPILVGQSWGGNVLLEFAARHPGLAAGYVFVDGGFINLGKRGTWEEVKTELRPPDLIGTPRPQITDRIRHMHPDWSEEGIQGTLGNFEILEDDTIRPWLTLDRHLQILHAMYEQDPAALYPKVQEPVLICAADDGGDRMPFKRAQIQDALAVIDQAQVLWFPGSAHDIHVDQPEQLAHALLAFEKVLSELSRK